MGEGPPGLFRRLGRRGRGGGLGLLGALPLAPAALALAGAVGGLRLGGGRRLGGGGGSVSEEAVAGIVGVRPVDQDGVEEDMPSVTAKAT